VAEYVPPHTSKGEGEYVSRTLSEVRSKASERVKLERTHSSLVAPSREQSFRGSG
jgi:hypothetical protein